MSGSWKVEVVQGEAAGLHAASAEALGRARGRTARILVAELPTVVLGSSEPEEWFDPGELRRSGLGLARRRSGGGAVLVGPGQVVWVDFIVPAGDPLWNDDVGRAAWWVGELWAEVLADAGWAGDRGPTVWKGPMRRNRWSPVVCFAGVGPGEVEIDGEKVVGVSQRRTRRSALFQSAALLESEPGRWLRLLSETGRAQVGLGPAEGAHPEVPPDLAGAARGLGAERERELIDGMVKRLDDMIF